MSEEPKTTEAEPKTHGDITASIARMTACLEDVIANSKAALELTKNMDRDGMKWMTLSKAVFDVHERSRMGWQKIMDPAAGTGGMFFTKPELLDFVMANPPLDIPSAAEPIQPGPPQMVPGEQPWKAIESDSCGIIRHNGIVRAWAIRENAGVEVYAKQHFVDGKPTASWSFTGTVDCEKVIIGSIFGGRNKANQIVRFIRNGLLAARLRLKHKRMNRQAKAAAVAAVPTVPTVPTVSAAPHPAPLTPEEELADTIKRQKEEVQA